MGSRRQSREIALQVLYQLEINEMPPEEAVRRVVEHFEAPRSASPFAEILVTGVRTHRDHIDRTLASASENWRVDRMSPVDRNILRIALYEILFCDDIPPRVSVNEAIELAKRYGSADSRAFVNGVLDHILNLVAVREASPEPEP
ncbi:transcription antitermination factor NusB [Desulfoglaeba alkanexedens]|uniref:Transcription antitermination protein NusB n=1 Tax=Desulfoglaeba alkanexedens ALDC TaxID=980445 RepID=A0A4P8L687_9BACT|nr:transcription antitermination factor NusB [Desulfoglaeba alkanexedens]QCQ22615.1 transcription antitermination factor NusB [Desulfoglaeba alkanexedens ALDC]